VRNQDAADRAMRHSHSRVSRDLVNIRLVVRKAPDECKAVVSFETLSRPLIDHFFSRRKTFCRPPPKSFKTLFTIVLLPGAVIFATDDQDVMGGFFLDTNIVIRITGIPKQYFLHRALRRPHSNRIRSVW